ncbi:helix-turn-helix transcriptional regulator [uncultured Martelella sp.]|uniref:AraC family transcriptional regulator n=1 Tax=uncultured Martelella sp. TaxID=392331 RepID=UPI0029C65C05|nr:helix-turn-helix transcriptional regulator [uncultured Martelella sp.]
MTDRPPTEGEPPAPVSFRTVFFPAGTVFPPRIRRWGKLNYALSGVCEYTIDGTRYLSPPQYGIWIPPGAAHEARNSQAMHYVSVYVASDLCRDLPEKPGTLDLSPLLKAILADFAARGVTAPKTAEDMRLASVLVDQIRLARRFDSYLPFTDDALLGPILRALQTDPGNPLSLAEWARRCGTTERTLSRRCQSELGISFHEWRQRARLIAALTLLDDDEPVHLIASRLGYSTPSAFISMFRRMTGTTPTQISR